MLVLCQLLNVFGHAAECCARGSLYTQPPSVHTLNAYTAAGDSTYIAAAVSLSLLGIHSPLWCTESVVGGTFHAALFLHQLVADLHQDHEQRHHLGHSDAL